MERGHEAILDKLLKAGADANTRSSVNDTAMQMAATKGHEMVVERLLEAGAEIDISELG